MLLLCRYQQMLHRNLVYLATIADSNQNAQALLPVSTDQWSSPCGHSFIPEHMLPQICDSTRPVRLELNKCYSYTQQDSILRGVWEFIVPKF